MRKTFLNAAALTLALLAVSPALQSCKDYDDDITNINGVNDNQAQQILDLKKQVEDLTEAQKNAAVAASNAASAAEAARQLAEQALQAGNKAEADALAAQSMASDAKAAAEQAKADMLAKLAEEAKALQALITANQKAIADAYDKIGQNTSDIAANAVAIAANTEAIAANAKAIAELDGKIAAVDAKLANYSTTEDMVAAINKAIDDNNANIDSKIDAAKADVLAQITAVAERVTAVETQQATLANYVTTLQNDYSKLSENVEGLSAKIAAQEASISTLTNDLNTVKTELTELGTKLQDAETKIADLDSRLTALDGELNKLAQKVTAIEDELSTLTTVLLPGRLSSVTLVPNLYIGGIPTIEFMTISYNAWEADEENEGLYNVTEKKFEITSNDAIAHYRLNPTTVADNDIKIDELSYVSSRAVSRAAEEAAIKVSKASITDGVLDVWVKNNQAGNLTNEAKSEITVATLRVPIADKHLFESEKTTGAYVFSEYTRVAESYISPVIKAIPSSDIEGYDYTQYNLKNFADNSNVVDALNGKDFIAIDVVYNGEGQDLLDIVEGQYNTDPAIVVSKEELNAWGLDFSFVLFSDELCADDAYASIEGSTIKAAVPEDAKLSDAIGKTPWVAVLLNDVENEKIIDVQYVQVKFIQDIRPVDVTYTETLDLFCDTKDVTVDWKWMKENVLSKLNATNDMTPEEFISIYTKTTITATAPNGDDVAADLVAVYNPADENAYTWAINSADLDMTKIENQKFTGKIVCEDPTELFPTVTVNIDVTVKISDANMPKLSDGKLYWKNAEDGLQYMLAYPTDPRAATEDQVAEYNTNILQGRLAPYATNFLDCALWGTYFNNDKYTDPDNQYVWFTTEYSTGDNAFVNGQLPSTKTALNGLSLNFWIENNEAGIAMVQNQEKVLVDWKANLVGNTNSDAAPTFGQCWIYVVQPLFYQQIKNLSITDNIKGEPVICNLENSWKVTDYYENVVVDTHEFNFQHFYGLEAIEYNVGDAYITRGADPASESIGTCADYKVVVSIEGNTLTYTNTGAVLLEGGYIQIPVSLPHRWGVLKGTITVKLNPFK